MIQGPGKSFQTCQVQQAHKIKATFDPHTEKTIHDILAKWEKGECAELEDDPEIIRKQQFEEHQDGSEAHPALPAGMDLGMLMQAFAGAHQQQMRAGHTFGGNGIMVN